MRPTYHGIERLSLVWPLESPVSNYSLCGDIMHFLCRSVSIKRIPSFCDILFPNDNIARRRKIPVHLYEFHTS